METGKLISMLTNIICIMEKGIITIIIKMIKKRMNSKMTMKKTLAGM